MEVRRHRDDGKCDLTNSMAYGTRGINAAFTRALLSRINPITRIDNYLFEETILKEIILTFEKNKTLVNNRSVSLFFCHTSYILFEDNSNFKFIKAMQTLLSGSPWYGCVHFCDQRLQTSSCSKSVVCETGNNNQLKQKETFCILLQSSCVNCILDVNGSY